jgi:hypothetical protein
MQLLGICQVFEGGWAIWLRPTSDIMLASLQRAAVMVGRRVSIELV